MMTFEQKLNAATADALFARFAVAPARGENVSDYLVGHEFTFDWKCGDEGDGGNTRSTVYLTSEHIAEAKRLLAEFEATNAH